MVAYERLLSNLTEITSAQQPSTSDAASDASGGAGSSSSSDEHAHASSSSSEEDIAPRRRVTHRGRFKKREASKAVSAYSCEDLTAIIGATASIVGGPSAAPVAPEAPAGKKRKCVDKHDADQQRTHEERKAERQEQAARDAKSWWNAYFCRAGRTGAGARPATSRKVRTVHSVAHKAHCDAQGGFSEEDQVALYNLNKEQERCGRQGLGVRGMPPKVRVLRLCASV